MCCARPPKAACLTPPHHRANTANVHARTPRAAAAAAAAAPAGFDPPFALEKGTNGLSMESFRFSVRTQFTSHLCCRKALKVMDTG